MTSHPTITQIHDPVENQSIDEGLRLPYSGAEMLASMARIYKHELSDFEAMLWTNQIFAVYPEREVMRALVAYMDSGSSDSRFMPKYGTIKAMLEPTRGFSEIERAVRTGSPYKIPMISDPVLIQAIHQMGGWAKVCAEMPDGREKPIDFDRYVKRFDAAITSASTQVAVQGVRPTPLSGIAEPRVAPAIGMTAPLAITDGSPPPNRPRND